MSIDWLQATTDHRKALYRAVRCAMDNAYLNWKQVFAQALHGERVGAGLEDTFRAGRIGRKKAHQIYEWLVRDHPEQAMRLDDELEGSGSPQADGSAWRAFLAAHGRYDGLSAVLLPDPALGIVGFADPEPLARPVIPLGAPFCFRLEAAFAGTVLAVQSVAGDWYALPLRADGLTDVVTADACYLPRKAGSDRPKALSEDEQAGRHGFVFLIGDAQIIDDIAARVSIGKPLPPDTRDAMAQAVLASQSPWRLHRINLLFRAQPE